MMMGNWDIAMVVWGVAWILLGTGLIYGIICVIAAEDQAVLGGERDAQRADVEPRPAIAPAGTRERPKVGAA